MSRQVDEPLVGEQARALIGTVTDRRTGTVVRMGFQRWAATLSDYNPLYFDPEYARAHGYLDVIAPPLYVRYVTLGVADLAQLRPDGTPAGDGYADLPLPGCPRRMAGGEDYTFYAPLYDGDVVTAVRTITDVVEKHGRSGAFVLVTATSVFTLRDGTPAAEIVETMIARP